MHLQHRDPGDQAGVQATPSSRVRKTGLAEKANEDTSGFPPGFGTGVPVERADAGMFILPPGCIFKSAV